MKIFVAAAVAAAALCLHRTDADYTVTVAPRSPLTTWEGWGTSLCWWANVFGQREDVADLLFTRNDSVSLPGSANLPALGFNIARYNIGGSGSNVVNNNGVPESMKVSPKMPAFKTINGFWLDWFNTDPTSASWDWSLDKTQRSMLALAKQRGVNIFEAFVNAPPWWMANNHAVAGGDNGKNDNLQSWNYDQFAYYLATVTKVARDSWGVTFDYVEPFNEPMANWWTFPGTQEGCHFSINTQKQVVQNLRKNLDALGLNSVRVAASDENSPDQTLSTLKSMAATPAAINVVNKINTHGYSGLSAYRGSNRNPLRDLIRKLGKTLWDSEYGESDGTGLSMAESIGLDINEMGVSAFVYWQALDSGGWGLMMSNPGDNWIGTPNGKYYVMAQYSRHIKPGMQIITSGDKKTVAAYDASRRVLVLVTVNTGTSAQTVTSNLEGFSTVEATSATAWTTVTTDGGARYQPSVVAINGKSLQMAMPAASVVTLEVEGVTV